MANLIIYKNMLDGEILEEQTVKDIRLSKVLYSISSLMGKHVFVYVNNSLIHANDWYDLELEESDVVHVLTEIEDPVSLGIVAGGLIGGLMASTVPLWYGVAWSSILMSAAFWGAAIKGAMIGYAIGSLLTGRQSPSSPENPTVNLDSDANYSWEGPKLVERPDGPVLVVYGEHLIGGNIIMKYISAGEASSTTRTELAPNNVCCAPINEEDFKEANHTLDLVVGSPTKDNGWSGYSAYGIWVGGSSLVGPAYSGNYSLAMNPYSSLHYGTGNRATMAGTFTTILDITYSVSFMVLDYEGGVFVGVKWTDGDGTTISDTMATQRVGPGNWSQHTFKFKSEVSGGNAKVSIYFSDIINRTYDTASLADSHSLYLDVISIKRSYSSASTTYLNILIGLGEGPIKGIMKEDKSGVCTSVNDMPYVKINDQFLSTYEDAIWDYRLGTQTQSIIDGFHNTNTFYYDGSRLSKGTAYTYTTTGTDIDEVELQLSSPSLYVASTDDRTISPNKVTIKVEYIVTGSGDPWTVVDTIELEDKSRTKTYFIYKLGVLGGSPEQYDIRLTRQTPEFTADFYAGGDTYLEGVTEIVHDDIAYRNTALLALRIPASEQISGDISNVVTLVRGRTVTIPDLRLGGEKLNYDDCYWDTTASTYAIPADMSYAASGVTDTGDLSATPQWTQNPIWCERDFVLAKRYGTGEYYKKANWDDVAAKAEAKYCWHRVSDLSASKEHRFHMDIAISSFMPSEEAFKLFGLNFRGWTIWSNGKLKPVIDHPREPTMLFNVSNIKPRSVKTTYLPSSKIPNMVESQYANASRDYAIETLEYIDDDEWTSIKPINIEAINLRGTIRRSEVLRSSKYFLNCAKLCTTLQEFDADIDAIRCEPGDTVQIQNDSLAWGQGGRVVSANASSITVNKDITVTASTQQVRVRHSDGTLELKRIRNVPGATRTLNASGDFNATPPVDTVFSFGNPGADSKPFKVLTINKKDDNTAKLLCIEESSGKYADTTGVALPEPIYTTLGNPLEIPAAVINLKAEDLPNKPGALISFHPPLLDQNFAYANLSIGKLPGEHSNWIPYRSGIVASQAKAGVEVLGLLPVTQYCFKVTAYNSNGKKGASAYVSHKLSWDSFVPPDVTGLKVKDRPGLTTFVGKNLEFQWNKSSVVSGAGHWPAGQETFGIDFWSQEIEYTYLIKFYAGTTLIFTVIKQDTEIFLSYDLIKYLCDKREISIQTTFMIEVWGLNQNNSTTSANKNSLTVTNTAPDTPTGISAIALEDAVLFAWSANTDPDIAKYEVRTKVDPPAGGGAFGSWSDVGSATIYTRTLTASEMTDQAEGRSTIYTEVRAVDLYENISASMAAADIQCNNYEKEIIVSPTAGEGHYQYIQEALNAVPADGWKITLKQGTYDLSLETGIANYSGGLQVPNYNIDFEGVNRGAVIIQNNAGDDCFILHNLTKTYSFSSFTFDSQVSESGHDKFYIYGDTYADNTADVTIKEIDFLLDDSAFNDYGIIINKVSGNLISVKDCLFDNAYMGAMSYADIYAPLKFKNNIFKECQIGLHANARIKLDIIGNVMSGQTDIAFWLPGTTGIYSMTGNHVEGTTRTFVYATAASANATVTGNTFKTTYAGTSGIYGVQIEGSNHSVIGNTIDIAVPNVTGTVYGLALFSFDDGVATGNSITINAGNNTATHAGIYLALASRNIVDGNNIDMTNSDAKDIGVLMAATADDNQGNNYVVNCGAGKGIVQLWP